MKWSCYVLLSLVYACVHLTHIVLACVLLLNGWTPLTVRERAELADVSVMGEVLATYKEHRTADDTYTAAFKIIAAYKGHHLLSNVTRGLGADNVYNISNFGSKAKCFADLETGSRYILFLTLFEGQLSAQYDDLFGAAVPFSEQEEEEMNKFLGWNTWNEWSPCTTTCGVGRQFRIRDCPRNNGSVCLGADNEIRTCNLFACQDSHDLLSIMGLPDLPPGVSPSPSRPSAYSISRNARLRVHISRIFRVTVPSTFSILMTVKTAATFKKGYLLAVTDLQGKQLLAVFLGRKLKFQYLGHNYGFKLDLLDQRWHMLELSLDGATVSLRADCQLVVKRRLKDTQGRLGSHLVVSIGPYLSQYGNMFEGELEQLTFTSDPNPDGRQCGLPVLNPDSWELDNEISRTTQSHQVATQAEKHTAKCRQVCLNGGQCVHPGHCACPHGFYGTSCERSCTVPCQNGGECVGVEICRCREYYSGSDCSIPLCKHGCSNGGHCVSPNQCSCAKGFYGRRCQKVKCQASCLNGGFCLFPDKCQCPPLFYGKRCQKEKCPITCLNGGRCRHSQCQCPFGFTGSRCQRNTCVYEQFLVPYKQTYRKVIRENLPLPCQPWAPQSCFTTRLKYVLVTRNSYRTSYRCV